MKRALITGITGQDGSYLAELLLEKGYEVHGIVRRVAAESEQDRFSRINHFKDKITLHPGSIENYARMVEIIDEIKPDECYHLAAQSFVHESFQDSFSTFMANVQGTLNLLNAIHKKHASCKFYFAATSEMFGKVQESPQSERTPFYPRSPYGITKVTGFEITRNFREAYGMFACSGILFNHESERRGSEFVTRKVTKAIARIKNKKDNVLVLGNLDAKRDWGHARDYVEAMWRMLQQETPDDYVIATGKDHTIRQLLEVACTHSGLEYEMVDARNLTIEEADAKVTELRKNPDTMYVVQHPRFYRPAEVNELLGNPAKAKNVLGWEPKISFEEMIRRMIDRDMQLQA